MLGDLPGGLCSSGTQSIFPPQQPSHTTRLLKLWLATRVSAVFTVKMCAISKAVDQNLRIFCPLYASCPQECIITKEARPMRGRW